MKQWKNLNNSERCHAIFKIMGWTYKENPWYLKWLWDKYIWTNKAGEKFCSNTFPRGALTLENIISFLNSDYLVDKEKREIYLSKLINIIEQLNIAKDVNDKLLIIHVSNLEERCHALYDTEYNGLIEVDEGVNVGGNVEQKIS